jgi:hypothetical protein
MPANFDFSVEMPEGTKAAASLQGVSQVLGAEMRKAMVDIEGHLMISAVSFMHWKNPSGKLEQSIFRDSRVISNWQTIVGSKRPYAARREYGFSGMTDSLGRLYKDDPGQGFMEESLTGNVDYIESRIAQAAETAMKPFGT